METIKGCAKCGKPFIIPPGGDDRRRYCSEECRMAHVRQTGKEARDKQLAARAKEAVQP